MKCREVKRLLPAYDSDELSQGEREKVKQHLAGCAECRASLEAYARVRHQFSSLQAFPDNSDIKEAVMAEVRNINSGRKSKLKSLRPVFIAVPVVAAVIAGLMVWQPWGGNGPERIIAKAQAAIAKLQSYRVSMVVKEGKGATYGSTMEFAAPNRYHDTYTGDDGDTEEFILIGDELYGKGREMTIGYSTMARARTSMFSSMIAGEAPYSNLDYIKDVEKLPDEMVDGTVCVHYRGAFDFEKQVRASIQRMQENNARKGLPPLSKETQEQMLKEASVPGSMVIDLWIGKDDYLLRRMRQDMHGPDPEDMTQSGVVDFTFYDFDEPITIQAPLDADGQLLPGWTTTAPESPGITADIQATVDNEDPSHREIYYAITVTNSGTETLGGIEVKIIAVLPSNLPAGSVWHRWDKGQEYEPYNFNPGDSLDYASTFGYDATAISPDVIAQIISDSFVRVSYTLPDGERKVETFHFQAPDSIYALPAGIPAGSK